ncbi:hypothetical protein MRX96_010448 [Rhipicephalus microplus]
MVPASPTPQSPIPSSEHGIRVDISDEPCPTGCELRQGIHGCYRGRWWLLLRVPCVRSLSAARSHRGPYHRKQGWLRSQAVASSSQLTITELVYLVDASGTKSTTGTVPRPLLRRTFKHPSNLNFNDDERFNECFRIVSQGMAARKQEFDSLGRLTLM